MVAKICHFYKIGINDALNLGTDVFMGLWDSITILEAQDQLSKLKASDYPNWKPKDRKQYHKWVYDRAFPAKEKVLVVTQNDLNRVLGLNNG